MSWPVVKLHDICRPKQWKTIAASNLLESGYPVYGANGKIGFYSEFTHESPTLMITCRGATCGNVHISEPKSYINGNAMALDDIDSSAVDLKYLYYFFLKRGFTEVDMSTFYLLDNGQLYKRSSAALRLIPYLKWFWIWLNIFWLFPKFLRDPMYVVVSRNRYKIFKRKCDIGTLSEKRDLDRNIMT